MGLLLEGNAGTTLAALIMDGRDRNEVGVAVVSLDSGKHSAVVFHDSKNPNNTAPSSNNSTRLSSVGISGSRKGFSNRGRGISKKRNKILHGNNTRFKIAGSQRVSLKESMEQLLRAYRPFPIPI
ncbi:hypothetical protein J1N35_035399 [Gossypium stocksii]|uniref:Uncharacterized protein n=1 Tax=Gossypium stocksii TaxID=47602 RepID=A0A9D3UVM5_9ROSI|nr:hypothetical protein J1N35_035399 [Gossypium stocksii]